MIFQWVRYKVDLQEGDTKVFSSWKETFFLAFMSPQLAAFCPCAPRFSPLSTKKVHEKKSLLLKTGQWNERFCLEQGRGLKVSGAWHLSSNLLCEPFSPPHPHPGADSSKFRQYCLLQGWQISLIGEYSILNQTNIPIWTGYRLDPQASQAHAFTEVSRERTQFPKRICGIPDMDVWTRLV